MFVLHPILFEFFEFFGNENDIEIVINCKKKPNMNFTF